MAETETETETDELRDTEITLGTGKLLGIFFGLVLLCSVFFTLGYMLGRSNSAAGKVEIVGNETGGSSAGKPSAVVKPGQAASVANNPASQANSPAASPSPVPVSASTPAVVTPASASGEAPAATPSGVTYVVQVAAVSKREDADLLVSALQKKQYPVFVANTSGDSLFHVQVGPFTDPKDAETMRSKLVAEGYNPIVKK
jgi:cell division septation protein DedD